MLELNTIGLAFDQKKVFEQLSCRVYDGDFIVIVGPNGAGKSTLFDLIAGRVSCQQGSMLLDGHDITHRSELDRAAYVGRLFQNTYLSCVAHMTVAQNLALATYKGRFASLRSGMKHFPKYLVEEVLKPFDLGLETLLHAPMGSLSGGQRQIISLVMATIVKPRILLLDEPTAALDPVAATKLLTFANRYIKEHTITTLMITHDPMLARTLGNRLWVLEQGGIAKEYAGAEKDRLDAHDMSGDIDYAAIRMG